MFHFDFLRKDSTFISDQSFNLILGVCNIVLLDCLALGAGKPNIDEMNILYFLVSVKYDVDSRFEVCLSFGLFGFCFGFAYLIF